MCITKYKQIMIYKAGGTVHRHHTTMNARQLPEGIVCNMFLCFLEATRDILDIEMMIPDHLSIYDKWEMAIALFTHHIYWVSQGDGNKE